jgi:hypothetical protein
MNFKQLCENFNVYKSVKREYYPRQIKFSPKFLSAVSEEYKRQQLEEDTGINNHRAKFIKALNFHLRQIDTGQINEETQEQKIKKQRREHKNFLRKHKSEVKNVLKRNVNRDC